MNSAAKKFKKYQILVCWGHGPRYLVGHGHNSLKAARLQAQALLSEGLRKYKGGAHPWAVVLERKIIADAERI